MSSPKFIIIRLFGTFACLFLLGIPIGCVAQQHVPQRYSAATAWKQSQQQRAQFAQKAKEIQEQNTLWRGTHISSSHIPYPHEDSPHGGSPHASPSHGTDSYRTDTSIHLGQASSELYQPWRTHEFAVRNNEPSAPYRLVSETQANTPSLAVSSSSGATTLSAKGASEKTPPPASGLSRLLAPRTTPSNTAPSIVAQSSSPSSSPPAAAERRIPLLGIGRDILNEFRPSNDRKWAQNHAVLQTAEFHGENLVTVRNVRYSRYESAENYTTQYYDATFNLDDIRSIDLVMVPFQGFSRIAHVESSFGFADGRHIGLSIEARYEEGEQYDPAAAPMRQFELIYLLADERDMIRLATDVNKNNVYIYRLNFEPHEVRVMFVDALQRANQLAGQPEFYHPLSNSCVTNLIAHINKGRPGAVPREYRTFMPGLLDSYMYDLNLMSTPKTTFKETKELAKVNWLVERFGDLEWFSAGIRQQNVY